MGSSISAGFLADQVLFDTAYGLLALFFVLQLLVERKAKYDEHQLNEKERITAWNSDRKRSVARRSGASDDSAVLAADGSRTDRDGHVEAVAMQGRQDNRSVDQDSYSTDHPIKPVAASEAPARPPRRPLKVGAIQWSFHRLGLLASLLSCWRGVDPYGVHDIFSYRHLAYLYYNSSALIFVAALFSFYFPIHLVRATALKQDSTLLKLVGGAQAILCLLVANIIPSLFFAYGPKHWLRSIVYLYFGLELLVTCAVFTIYMQLLDRAIKALIAHHIKVETQRANTFGPPSARDRSPSPGPGDRSSTPLPGDEPPAQTVVTFHSVADSQTSGSLPLHSPSDARPMLGSGSAEVLMTSSSLLTVPPAPQPAASPNAAASQKAGRFVKHYQEMMRKMRVFQLIGTSIALTIAILLVAHAGTLLKTPSEVASDADPARYSSASSFIIINVVNVAGLALGAWYAYMPLSVLLE